MDRSIAKMFHLFVKANLIWCILLLIGGVSCYTGNISQTNDNFGFELLANLISNNSTTTKDQNILISTFSISTALTMLMAGGAGNTYTEIHDTLGYANLSMKDEQLFESYHQLLNELNEESDKGTLILIANAVAVQKNQPLKQRFINNITDTFQSRVFVEDFTKESKQATNQINQWVSQTTQGKIPKLFTDDLTPETILVLMNAIYFNGTWKVKFNKAKTRNEPFSVENGSIVNMKAMNVIDQFNYAKFDDGEMIEIPYQKEIFSMYVFLPKTSTDSNSIFSQLLSPATQLQQRIEQLKKKQVNIVLPKFKIENTHSLVAPLKMMRIRDAFGNKANFTNINDNLGLQVSDILHRTLIEVDEEGTEAAAATGAIFKISAAMIPKEKTIVFNANKPFLFLIRHRQSELTLFAGIVHNPSTSSF